MNYTVTKLGEEELAEVIRLQQVAATEWESGMLSAWVASVADPVQRRQIVAARRFQREGAR